MEESTVFESEDYQKTIEEINTENTPKIISKSKSIYIPESSSTIYEKIEYFKSLFSKRSAEEYSWERKIFNRNEKLKIIETEIINLASECEEFPKDSEEYSASKRNLALITEKFLSIKEKVSKVNELKSAKLEFPKNKSSKDEKVSKGMQLEVEISDFDKQRRIVEFNNKVTEIENVIGDWKEKAPISESLSHFLLTTYLVNENILEKIREQALHLHKDLESMLSGSNQATASYEAIQEIEKLFDLTYDKVKSSEGIGEIITKMKVFQSVFLKSSEVDKSLQKFETSAKGLETRISESLESINGIKEGMSENQKAIAKSLEALKHKINRI